MLVESLVLAADLQPDDLILDIGCNDGIMLDAYERFLNKAQRVGVDPSSVCLLAKEKGYQAYQSPINVDLANNILSDIQDKFKIITATNVFAHIDNIHEVVESIKVLLDEDGIFVIEAPYLFDMLQNGYFDVIYHEHYSYLSLMPVKILFEKYGLSVFNVEKSDVAASGPSVRYFISWNGKKEINKNIELMLQDEKKLINQNIFDYFSSNVKRWKEKLLNIIHNELKDGGNIGFIGAPAKGNTLLNYLFEDSIEGVRYIAEVNEKKIGTYSPGVGLEIIREDDFNRIPFSLAILLTWNYSKYFIDKFKQEKPGYKLVIPLPAITVYE
jgi:SAM-dependent methyltransferase